MCAPLPFPLFLGPWDGRGFRQAKGADASGSTSSSVSLLNQRETLLGRVIARPTQVEVAATFRAPPGAAPESNSFQKIPQPPASTFPTPGAVKSRPTAATARGRPTSTAWPVAAIR